MATIGNAPVFPTESVLPGNLQVTGNATISGSSATVNGNEVRTVGTSGAILQVVQGTATTEVTVSTASFTDLGLSASITPTSSSNKILVSAVLLINSRRSNVEHGGGFRMLRDSTVIIDPPANATGPYSIYGVITTSASVTFNQMYIQYPMTILDSPATTSSVTYKVQGRPYNTATTGQVRINPIGTLGSPTSFITLMEVVA